MDTLKSQDDVYVDLIEALLHCNPSHLSSVRSLSKDIAVLRHRYTCEGLSFLTKTLPKLGKALDNGLAVERFQLPCEFLHSHSNRSIPAFMQAYFNRVFDCDGVPREDADPDAVSHLRQVLFFAYKLELPYSEKQKSSIIDGFVATDGQLELQDDVEANQVIEVASFITEDIFSDFDPMDIRPQHGPGAVATGEKLEEKWLFKRLYSNIHRVFPYYDYFMVGGGRELIDRLGWYKSLTRLESGVAKVVLVPKDSRGPRLISCEPLEYQWIQQGLGRKLVQHLESYPMTRGRINFTHQSVNRELAQTSSLTREYATLDMKDASDRVSIELVNRIFKRSPKLLRALMACRSSATRLPDGRVITLNKFAPMGSAICFPVEAYVFWVICVAAISRHRGLRQADVAKDVFVYGDDIIVPTRDASLCIQTLEYYRLLVNRSKCCIHGYFRESCGLDAFKGIDVTPTRLHTRWSGRRTDGSAYAAYISVANSLSQKGYIKCSDMLWELIEATYGKVPYGTSVSSFPCHIVCDPEVAEHKNAPLFRCRTSRHYQRLEFFLPTTSSRRIKSELDGWLRLARNIISRPFGDPSSIVVPRSMIIKRGWTAVY